MSEELQAKTRKAALASVHVNHPGAAYKIMRELAEHSLDLCDRLEASEARCKELEEATRHTKVFPRALEKTLRSRDVNLAAVIRNHLRSTQGG